MRQGRPRPDRRPGGEHHGDQRREDRPHHRPRQAQTTRGLGYAWGGGGRGGPSCGTASLSPSGYNDYNRFGFDCSGFTDYIFWAAAGKEIGQNTDVQSVQAIQVPYSSVKAGDLIFWGSPGNTDHVALYIGNGRIIEAARRAVPAASTSPTCTAATVTPSVSPADPSTAAGGDLPGRQPSRRRRVRAASCPAAVCPRTGAFCVGSRCGPTVAGPPAGSAASPTGRGRPGSQGHRGSSTGAGSRDGQPQWTFWR
ncbi:C40 family peptidase [Kitasatospora sp. KL5]|uniref:C40 family peptidase n=1 Tax=Kitasatospora sp. KL5 TaxID=3425125 RepID=UPI003D702151